LAYKAHLQATNDVQPVEETNNVLVNGAISSQQSDENNAVENKEDQNSSVITNQEVVTSVNESVAPSVSDPKPEEVTKDSAYKKGMLGSKI